MFFGTRYEVKCDETFAYYEGYVFDLVEEKDPNKEPKLRVAYPWKEDQLVPVNYVRPLAPPVEPNWKPQQGDHVEVEWIWICNKLRVIIFLIFFLFFFFTLINIHSVKQKQKNQTLWMVGCLIEN